MQQAVHTLAGLHHWLLSEGNLACPDCIPDVRMKITGRASWFAHERLKVFFLFEKDILKKRAVLFQGTLINLDLKKSPVWYPPNLSKFKT